MLLFKTVFVVELKVTINYKEVVAYELESVIL